MDIQNDGNQHSAGELADAFERRLEGASFKAGASALVAVLTRRIAEGGQHPVREAQVYGAALETLVEQAERSAEEKGIAGRAAA